MKCDKERRQRLMPRGIPKYIRVYDNSGASFDRYTVVYTGHYQTKLWTDGKLRDADGHARDRRFLYVGMSEFPFHPQGFGQHGEATAGPIDVTDGWPPAMGRKNHLGTRIPFSKLPPDCKRLVKRDYNELWNL